MLYSLVILISTLVFLTQSTLSDVTKEKAKLPEIKDGDKCIYGKMYKMDCNTCRCGHQNHLLCTKVACLRPMKSEVNENPPKANKRSKLANEKKKKKKAKKIKRRENAETVTTASPGLPSLPTINNTCIPGRIYQEGCRRCLCNSNREPECSIENACEQKKAKRDLLPGDIRPPIKDREFHELTVLPHSASPCKAGKTYKVECNACVCDEFQNLLCDKLLCISFADMHRAEALKKSGLPCNSENTAENEVMQSKCVQCACNNGTTYCQAKPGCVAETELILRTRRNGLSFNYTAEKCAPDHVYKDDCNKCYCQEDQTLRCTQKTCLNYNQAVILEKQQKYLQEHGL
ncbi:hypothetical protein PYW07_009652 [Mythimna separata]|uniref:Pacifastin domain-containing protein n=1 Tax=Mythimna separata TaxID=271217 RepID=A0AAD8DND0_MYTSE|nr:hypothetical protein PYW07_009652 [Mythimna separata]